MRGNIGVIGAYNVGGDIDYVILGEGLDSWDIGINSWKSYTEKYLQFRKIWKGAVL